MAIKSANQITLMDVTDGYSVILTSEAYTFLGEARVASGKLDNQTVSCAKKGESCTTQIYAFCGSEQCTNIRVFNADTKDFLNMQNGIDVSATGWGTSCVTLTFTVVAEVLNGDDVTIPVFIDDVTINKTFTFHVADTGKVGNKGDTGDTGASGEDAITLKITSSNDVIFRNNSGSTVLTAHIFKGSEEQEITDAGVVANSLGTIKWYKGANKTLVATAKTLTVSASDVDTSAVYTAQLE